MPHVCEWVHHLNAVTNGSSFTLSEGWSVHGASGNVTQLANSPLYSLKDVLASWKALPVGNKSPNGDNENWHSAELLVPGKLITDCQRHFTEIMVISRMAPCSDKSSLSI